ncbi:MAG TPA: hypothetical protein VGM33_15215 [Baekduia sp.]
MSIGKRGLIAAGAALAAGVLAAVALGQEITPTKINATVTVTPHRAGTPSHPRGIRIAARGTITTSGGTVPSTPQSVDLWLPRDWVYNGAKHPTCALATLTRRGPGACPPQSIMGQLELGHVEDRPSTSPPQATIVNGGQTKMYFSVRLLDPAPAHGVVTATITRLRSPRWSYRLHADIPSSLRVVSGIPIALQSFDGSIGRGDWIATTHCPPDHRWRYRLRMTYPSGPLVDTGGELTCRS